MINLQFYTICYSWMDPNELLRLCLLAVLMHEHTQQMIGMKVFRVVAQYRRVQLVRADFVPILVCLQRCRCLRAWGWERVLHLAWRPGLFGKTQ